MTQHHADISLQFDRTAQLPEQRDIEAAGRDPQPQGAVATVLVQREPYLASPDLESAVNLAIALARPLLLQGDPGAGKTRLAHAVAYALGLPLEEAYIKSTSRGQDLLYTFDAVRRLYDAQLGRGRADADDARGYVSLGPLGRVIARAAAGRRSVLLIDEIDKADLDFPNDLLRELDQLAFDVPEVPGLRYEVPTDRLDLRPIILVTNNEEKALPGAFLRRCIFHFVEFPTSTAALDAILQLHGVLDRPMRARAATMLVRLRELDLAKKPGLSELLDWVRYLHATGVAHEAVAELPHRGALLKQRSDQVRVADWLAQP